MTTTLQKIYAKIFDNGTKKINAKSVRESFALMDDKIEKVESGIKGVLKISDPKPAPDAIGKYELADIGEYSNLIPIIPFGGTEPQNTPITTEDGFYNSVFWDGVKFTQSKTLLPVDPVLEGKTEETRNFQITKNIDDYERSQLVSLNAGNQYLDENGIAHNNPNCVISEKISVDGYTHLIAYLTMHTAGYCCFFRNGILLSGFWVQNNEVGKKVEIPELATDVQFCSFTDVIEKPVALLVGAKKKEVEKTGISIYKPTINFIDSWNTDSAGFIKVELPNINYNDGYLFDFQIKIADIKSLDAGIEDNVLNLRINLLAYPAIQKAFISKIFGNSQKIKSVKVMRDENGILCIVLERLFWLNIYRYEISDLKVISQNLKNVEKEIVSDVKILEISDTTDFTELYDFTKEIYSDNPLAGKSVLITGDSITAGYDKGIEKNIYPNYIGEKFQTSNVTKYGNSGGTIATGTWSIHILSDERLSMIKLSAPDIIIIMGAINDYQTDMPVGDISSDRSTTVGSLKYAIEYLQKNLPSATILYCTSGQYYYSLSGPVHSGRVPNSQGKTARDYFQACIDLCKLYAIPVVDFNAECGWLDSNEIAGHFDWTTDGLHFSAKAYDKLTTMQFNKLKTLF